MVSILLHPVLVCVDTDWQVDQNRDLPWAQAHIRACPGPSDEQSCVWKVNLITVENTNLKTGDGTLALLSRCVQCHRLQYSAYFQTHKAQLKQRKDEEGRLLCASSMSCPEPRHGSNLHCERHFGKSILVLVRYVADRRRSS